MLKPTQIQTIESFAKTNKISKAKLQTFAETLLADLPKVGRKMSADSIALYDNIVKALPEYSGTFTAKELASRFKANPVYVNNALKRLQSEGKISQAGKVTGKKGKPALLWKTKK